MSGSLRPPYPVRSFVLIGQPQGPHHIKKMLEDGLEELTSFKDSTMVAFTRDKSLLRIGGAKYFQDQPTLYAARLITLPTFLTLLDGSKEFIHEILVGLLNLECTDACEIDASTLTAEKVIAFVKRDCFAEIGR